MTNIDPYLPVGTHPGDQRSYVGPGFDANMPIGPDLHGKQYTQGRKAWGTDNDQALTVWQRASHDWSIGLIVVTQDNDGVSQIIGRQPGRASLSLWVPTSVMIAGTLTTTPAGVMLAPTSGELSANTTNGAVLNVGDSLQILSEGSCYAGLIPGQTVGYIQYVSLTNPVGGGLGTT